MDENKNEDAVLAHGHLHTHTKEVSNRLARAIAIFRK